MLLHVWQVRLVEAALALLPREERVGVGEVVVERLEGLRVERAIVGVLVRRDGDADGVPLALPRAGARLRKVEIENTYAELHVNDRVDRATHVNNHADRAERVNYT